MARRWPEAFPKQAPPRPERRSSSTNNDDESGEDGEGAAAQRALLAQVTEEQSRAGLWGGGGQDAEGTWEEVGWGSAPGEAARVLPARQVRVPCVCLLLTPPHGL